MIKKEIFSGFTPGTFQFLKDLKENNYKEWFDAHKHIYESELLNPLKALLRKLSPAMYAIDPIFDVRPHRAISRIYRDTRFSKDKSPYKTFMWMSFQRPVTGEEWKDYPGYFLELTEDSYSLGMGLFQPKKKVMDNFRDAVSYDAEEFQRVTQATVLDRGFTVGGEDYKRPLPNDLPAYFQPWIQRKGINVFKTMPITEEVFSATLADKIIEDFVALEWLFNFLKEATLSDYD